MWDTQRGGIGGSGHNAWQGAEYKAKPTALGTYLRDARHFREKPLTQPTQSAHSQSGLGWGAGLVELPGGL